MNKWIWIEGQIDSWIDGQLDSWVVKQLDRWVDTRWI